MATTSSVSGVLRGYVLPALLLFALPVFGLWFTGYASNWFDERIRSAISQQVMQDRELDEVQRKEVLEAYSTFSAVEACMSTDEERAGFRASFGDGCTDAMQFGWAYRGALGLVLLGLASALIALMCGLAAFISRPIQYLSFVVGWNLLRIATALQVIGQGALAVWLSYWVTAVLTQRYSVKLILAVGLMAAGAAFLVVVAIFKRPPMDFEVEAEVVEESKAPELWAHVRKLCQRLQTPPPDHLLAGIDANFFVTEGDIRVGERTLRGRTLFVSLSLLRQLERREAEAVLAHEMGHLLGGDTGHGKRLAPMLARFGQYLEALHEGGLTRPVYYFMLSYRGLFELSLGRSRRASEFAADRLAASVTSGRDVAHSLVKVVAYANFRDRVEAALFNRDEQHQSVAIAQRVAHGFAEYAQSEALQGDLNGSVTPHPFDSHPPLSARLENVGVKLSPEDMGQMLVEPVTSSWAEAFEDADGIEARLWRAYESRFSKAHDVALAYRYAPSNDEEREHVERYFPPMTFEAKEEGHEVRLSFAEVYCEEWAAPVHLDEVTTATTEDRMFKKYLDLLLNGTGATQGKVSICLNKLKDSEALLAAFGHYLGRHRASKDHQQSAERDAA
ncbi:M48 family metallopeptidase [Myxococcus sp. MISCRS1]|uniref:M48 family metallopeptidase n=1 Tax=Myxococcus sp. MISCRS1 TaxID=2996786 RepID=UPI00226D8E04|nr:M48 family metallopeptidase [Myxococcus sp. MISCRS1]MCY0997607.1 M48 family metallopeptidase [Myxococcus sp. MISCRS1]